MTGVATPLMISNSFNDKGFNFMLLAQAVLDMVHVIVFGQSDGLFLDFPDVRGISRELMATLVSPR